MLKVIITFLLSYMFMVLPLPVWANWLTPQWVLLFFIYWALVMPARFGIVTAWFFGLLLDVLLHTPLGGNALFFVLLSYLLQKWHRKVYLFSVWEMALSIFVISVTYALYKTMLLGLPQKYLLGLSQATITVLVWLWITTLLQQKNTIH